MADLSIGLNCPACGGAISIQEGENVVNCQYCSSTLWVEGDKGVYTVAFKNKVTKDSAKAAAQNWWKHGLKARDLKTKGIVTEVYPIYLPFWNISTRVVGWVCGYEDRKHSDSKGNTTTERIYKEQMVLQDVTFSQISCDPGDLGIKKLRNFSGESSFEDFEMIPTFESTTSKDDALNQAREEALAKGKQSANIPNVTFERLHAFPKRISMIYYPVWVLRYTYLERVYLLTVDGVTGKVLSGRAPGDPLFQSLAITAGTSVGGLAAAGGAMIISSEAQIGVGLMVVGFAVLAAMYYFFRHGSERAEGDFLDKKKAPDMKQLMDIGKVVQGAYR